MSFAPVPAFTHAVQHCDLKLGMPLILTEHARLAVLWHGTHDGRTRRRSDNDNIGSGRHHIKEGVMIIELPHGTERETSLLRQNDPWTCNSSQLAVLSANGSIHCAADQRQERNQAEPSWSYHVLSTYISTSSAIHQQKHLHHLASPQTE